MKHRDSQTPEAMEARALHSEGHEVLLKIWSFMPVIPQGEKNKLKAQGWPPAKMQQEDRGAACTCNVKAILTILGSRQYSICVDSIKILGHLMNDYDRIVTRITMIPDIIKVWITILYDSTSLRSY